MIRPTLLASALTASLVAAAGAQQADPEDFILLISRYADACTRLSAEECELSRPVSVEDAQRLACLFDQLDTRAGPGTAEKHVVWAEAFAETGQPPATGFPTTIGEQETLIASMIACRGAGSAR